MRLLLLVVISVALGACGGRPPVPKRLVVEGDVGSWKFRRFQGPLLDIEVWVEGNKGEAYSASYITASSEKIGHIADKDLVNVTVTKYERRDGIVRETVRLVRRLAAEKGYQVNEKKTKGVRGLVLTGPNETWMMWPSGNYVVKVGGQGRETVPDQVIASYGNRYPSQLPGGSLEGPLPPGPEDKPKTEPKEQYDPKNPKPDIDKYDPKKVKIPERKVDTTGPETEGTGDADKKEKEKKKKDEKKDKKKDDKKSKKTDDDEKPKAKKKDADDEEKPKKAKKDEDEKPKKKAKKKDAEDEDEKPKKKAKKKDAEDEDEKPKKKKKKVDDDEE